MTLTEANAILYRIGFSCERPTPAHYRGREREMLQRAPVLGKWIQIAVLAGCASIGISFGFGVVSVFGRPSLLGKILNPLFIISASLGVTGMLLLNRWLVLAYLVVNSFGNFACVVIAAIEWYAYDDGLEFAMYFPSSLLDTILVAFAFVMYRHLRRAEKACARTAAAAAARGPVGGRGAAETGVGQAECVDIGGAAEEVVGGHGSPLSREAAGGGSGGVGLSTRYQPPHNAASPHTLCTELVAVVPAAEANIMGEGSRHGGGGSGRGVGGGGSRVGGNGDFGGSEDKGNSGNSSSRSSGGGGLSTTSGNIDISGGSGNSGYSGNSGTRDGAVDMSHDAKLAEERDEFLCPISQCEMVDPVVAADGHSYDRASIAEWFRRGKMTSPLTGKRLESTALIPNHRLRSVIEGRQQRAVERHK